MYNSVVMKSHSESLREQDHFELLFDMISNVHEKKNATKQTPNNLFDAVKKGDCDAIENQLLNTKKHGRNDHGRSILHEAVVHGHVNITIMLIDKFDVDINIRSMLAQETPLHFAVATSNKEIIHELLRRGADPNMRNKRGYTAIHYAQTESIMALLNLYGATKT